MERMKVIDLKALAKECWLQGYSKLRKAELITFLQNNLQPTPAPCTRPPKPTIPHPPPSAWEPINDRPRPTPRPSPKPIPAPRPRPIPPPRPYQLKPKRGKETFIEPPVEQKELPPANLKQFKRMEKKLDKLNKKIRHSEKDHNNLISKRNSIKKKIKELKGPHEPEPEESFNPIEFEQAFSRAYRSYRVNGRSRMDIGTFFDQIRQNLIDDLMNRVLTDLGSARVQTTAWIRFIQALEDDFGNIIGSDRVEKPFNSKMTGNTSR